MKITTAKILRVAENKILLQPFEDINRELQQKQITTVELRLDDGRTISAEQRRKTWALINDIDDWMGNYLPEVTRSIMETMFIAKMGYEWFSLSNVDMTTAKEFITFLINFCFENSVPTRDTLLNQTDDIGKYLYMCLEHRKCAICNDKAEVHHVDRVGAGRNRDEIVHIGMRAIALCHKHHMMAHQDEKGLFERYFVYGIKLDKYLCDRLNLNTKERR